MSNGDSTPQSGVISSLPPSVQEAIRQGGQTGGVGVGRRSGTTIRQAQLESARKVAAQRAVLNRLGISGQVAVGQSWKKFQEEVLKGYQVPEGTIKTGVKPEVFEQKLQEYRARVAEVGRVEMEAGRTREALTEKQLFTPREAPVTIAPKEQIREAIGAKFTPELSAQVRAELQTKPIQQTMLRVEKIKLPIDITEKAPSGTIEAAKPFKGKQLTDAKDIIGKEIKEEKNPFIKLEKAVMGLRQVGIEKEKEGAKTAPFLIAAGTAAAIPTYIVSTTVREGPLQAIEDVVFGTAEFLVRPVKSLTATTPSGRAGEVVGIVAGGETIGSGGRVIKRRVEARQKKVFERATTPKPEELSEFLLVGEEGVEPRVTPVEEVKPKEAPKELQVAFKKDLVEKTKLLQKQKPLKKKKILQEKLTKEKQEILPEPTFKLKTESGKVISQVKPDTQLIFKFPQKEVSKPKEAPKQERMKLIEKEIPKGDIRRKVLENLLMRGDKKGTVAVSQLLFKEQVGKFARKVREGFLIDETKPRARRIFEAEDVPFKAIIGEGGKGFVTSSLVATSLLGVQKGQPILSDIKPIEEDIIKIAEKERQRQIGEPISSIIVDVTQQPREKVRQEQRVSPIIEQVPKQDIIQKQKPRQITKPKPRKPKIPKRPDDDDTALLGLTTTARLKRAYNVYIREKKRFFKVNKKGLPFNKAHNFGRDIVDNSAAATYTIRKARKRTRERDDLIIQRPNKFREKKGLHIELNKHRIDSAGELRGITAKGLVALRRKRATQRRIKFIRTGKRGFI